VISSTALTVFARETVSSLPFLPSLEPRSRLETPPNASLTSLRNSRRISLKPGQSQNSSASWNPPPYFQEPRYTLLSRCLLLDPDGLILNLWGNRSKLSFIIRQKFDLTSLYRTVGLWQTLASLQETNLFRSCSERPSTPVWVESPFWLARQHLYPFCRIGHPEDGRPRK
jgi:hypothetical protein